MKFSRGLALGFIVHHRIGKGDSYYKALVPRTPSEIDALLDRVLDCETEKR